MLFVYLLTDFASATLTLFLLQHKAFMCGLLVTETYFTLLVGYGTREQML